MAKQVKIRRIVHAQLGFSQQQYTIPMWQMPAVHTTLELTHAIVILIGRTGIFQRAVYKRAMQSSCYYMCIYTKPKHQITFINVIKQQEYMHSSTQGVYNQPCLDVAKWSTQCPMTGM